MQSPEPSPPERSPRRFAWRKLLGRTLIVTSGVALVGTATGLWWLDRFVKTDLSPLLSWELSKSLNRPVLVGAVQGYSFTGVRVGTSSIPATPEDPDRVEIAAIAVSFNPLQLLTRRLDLNLTLINPDVYLEQEANGVWVRIPVQPEQPPDIIQSRIASVKVEQGTLALSPTPRPGNSRTTLTFTPLSGTGIVTGSGKTEQIALNLSLKAATGGGMTVQGDVFPAQGRTNLQLRLQQVALAEVGQLIQKPLQLTAPDPTAGAETGFLPVIFQSGQLSGTVAVQATPERFPLLTGTVDVTDVTTKVLGFPDVVTVSQGRVRLQGERLQLEQVTGDVAGAILQVSGALNTQYLNREPSTAGSPTTDGAESFFDLAGQVQAVSVADVLQRFGVKLPVPLVGKVQGDFQLTGSPQRPVVEGGISTTTPLVIDRVRLASVRSAFRFADSILTVSSLQASLATGGKLTGEGQLSLSPEGSVKATIQAADVDGDNLLRLYEARLAPDFTLGILQASGTISGSLQNLRGEVRWQAPTATYPGSGRIILAGDTILLQDTRLAVDGGTLQARGEIRRGEWQADVTTDTLQLGRVSTALQGTVSGRVSLSGRLDSLRADAVRADGDLVLSQGLATVKQPSTAGFAEPLTASFAWDGRRLLLRRVDSDRLSANGSIAASFSNNTPTITGLDLALRIQGFDLATLPGEGGRSPASGLASFTGQLRGTPTSPNVNGVLTVMGLGISQPGGSPIRVNQAIADFTWNGQRLTLRNASADGLSARGTIFTRIQGSTPQVTGLDVQVSARNYDLRSLPIPASTLQQAGITAVGGRATLDGRITGNLAALQVESNFAVSQFALSQRGRAPLRLNQLTAALRWDGRTLLVRNATADGSSLSGTIATNAQGSVPTRITALDLQLRLQDYDIAALPFPAITTPQGNLTPQGRLRYVGRVTGNPDNIALRGDLELLQVALKQPSGRSLVAWDQATFRGNVTGAIASLRAQGNLRVQNLQALGSPFEPLLSGTIDYTLGKGGSLAIMGPRDRVVIALGADNLPISFDIQRDQSIAQGMRQGDRLQLSLANISVADLQLQPIPGYGAVSGVVTGNLTINLRQGTGSGQVEIAKPTLGHLTADRFRGNLSYLNGIVTLTNGELQIGKGRYAINASAKPGAIPQFTANLTITDGQIQDLLGFFKWFDLTDIARGLQPPNFDRARDLLIYPVGDPNALLQAQLQRLAEIDKLLSQQIQEQRSNVIPDLRKAEGRFFGTVAVASTPATGLTANFDIQGTNWKLAPYQADTVTIRGDFTNNVLTLQPLRFASANGTASLTYAGPISVEGLSGQVRFQQLPVDNVIAFFDLPIPVSGKLTGTIALSGKLLEPRFQGQLNLVEGLLNDNEINSAVANFNYGSRRVNFRSVLTIEGPEPLVIEGSLPAGLPFDLAFPERDAGKVALTANLKNEGLALLNIFSQQVNWVDGKGAVNLQVQGDLETTAEAAQPPLQITGTLALQDAIFQVQGLPEAITGVTGRASFAGDRILVEGIEGTYGKGSILMKGYLPVVPTPNQPTNGTITPSDDVTAIQALAAARLPLTLSITNVGLNLKGLYRGQASGIVQVGGSVLDTKLSGRIELVDGLIFLPSSDSQATQADAASADDPSQLVQPPEFRDLQITLGNRVVITSPPLLSFVAKGDLLMNGVLNDIRPSGVIRLEAGQVNIGLAQLNLARGVENTATFNPRQGLDPTLNIRLVTSVQEVFRRPIATTSLTGFASSERADLPASALGALQTVRIRAEVNGLASQLQDRLTLTSSPPRSREELIALLGGTSSLEQGDGRSLEILAGTVLLTQIQSLIGNAVGLTDFRLFPTLIGSSSRQDSNRRASDATLGLAAEIGTDITDNLSVSLLQVLGSEQPTQYNLRYRFSDQILLRGSTDFSGDSRAVVEFSTRF